MTLSPFFSLKFVDTGMKPNHLLICKLIFILLVVHGFYKHINDPYIPFVPFLDEFNNFPNVFKNTLRTLFVMSGIFLLFNFKVRLMSFILGLIISLTLLASKAEFTNHYFICACVFLLMGIIDKKQSSWLLFVQLSLVYFGAVINKVFQVDWWNGEFMHNWLVNARENQIFIYVSSLFPEMWLAKLLSWGAMFTELSVAVLILFKKKHSLVVWMILLFHTCLYTLTAFRFGHFYEDILIILLIFINWPSDTIQVTFKKEDLSFIRKPFYFFNFNGTFRLTNKVLSNKNWLEVIVGDKTVQNWHALRLFLLYSTNFYIFLFVLDLLIRFMFNGFLMDFIHISVTWICILFFIPLLYKNKAQKDLRLTNN